MMNRSFTDQLGRTVSIAYPPRRIISIVPSQTELLYDLGLDEEVVGITKFCVHPQEWFRTKIRVGGTKNLKFDIIKSLNPDLILANKEEGDEGQIKQLMELYPVWVSDINTLDDALRMMHSVGAMTGKEEEADRLVNEIEKGYNKLDVTAAGLSVAYFIWRKPYMVVGGDTFLNHMLHRLGFKNIYAQQQRYPEVTLEDLKQQKPDIIVLSSEPYPFKEKHVQEFKQALPNSKIILVDGEYFSWYGSRLLKAIPYFKRLSRVLKANP